jgi:hypothetical protein
VSVVASIDRLPGQPRLSRAARRGGCERLAAPGSIDMSKSAPVVAEGAPGQEIDWGRCWPRSMLEDYQSGCKMHVKVDLLVNETGFKTEKAACCPGRASGVLVVRRLRRSAEHVNQIWFAVTAGAIMPAQAGSLTNQSDIMGLSWAPACAGMTRWGRGAKPSQDRLWTCLAVLRRPRPGAERR